MEVQEAAAMAPYCSRLHNSYNPTKQGARKRSELCARAIIHEQAGREWKTTLRMHVAEDGMGRRAVAVLLLVSRHVAHCTPRQLALQSPCTCDAHRSTSPAFMAAV